MSEEHWFRKTVREYFEATPPEKRHHAELCDLVIARQNEVFPVKYGSFCPQCTMHFEGGTGYEAQKELAEHRAAGCWRDPLR